MKVQVFDGGPERWDSYVEQSNFGSIFHRHQFLKSIEAATPHNLQKLIGFKGQEPVGLLPIFNVEKVGFPTIWSPPPGVGVPNLGPLFLNQSKLKQRKQEKRTRRFIESCLECIQDEYSPKYIQLKTPSGIDPRCLQWNGFDVRPQFMYRLDINNNKEDILKSFTRDLRSSIQNTDRENIEIYEGGKKEIRFIHEQISNRYDAQGHNYNIPLEFFQTLFDSMNDDVVRPYVASLNGELTAGTIILQNNDTIHYWQGGGKPDVSLPVNDLIHWEAITDAKDRGISAYNLEGANTPRICEYKSKFAPDVKEYYIARQHTTVSKLYSMFLR